VRSAKEFVGVVSQRKVYLITVTVTVEEKARASSKDVISRGAALQDQASGWQTFTIVVCRFGKVSTDLGIQESVVRENVYVVEVEAPNAIVVRKVCCLLDPELTGFCPASLSVLRCAESFEPSVS
jgi:hypothetical protein